MKTINNKVEEALRKLRADMQDNINYYYDVYDYKHGAKFIIVFVPVSNSIKDINGDIEIKTQFNGLTQFLDTNDSSITDKIIMEIISHYGDSNGHHITKEDLQHI